MVGWVGRSAGRLDGWTDSPLVVIANRPTATLTFFRCGVYNSVSSVAPVPRSVRRSIPRPASCRAGP